MINWGIIGCGDVTEIKSGPAFNNVPESRLVAVMRRDAAAAADYAHRHKVGKWYADADQLMDDPEINAVYIATPPAFHLPYAVAALKRGLHVYVEKPVTLNAQEAVEMAAAARLSDAKLSVAHYRRRLPLFLKIKELLDQGIVGEVRTVQVRLWQSRAAGLIAKTTVNWRLQPELSGGGYFHDLAPHQLDLLLYYFGDPTACQGYSLNQAGRTPADDHVCGEIIFNDQTVINGSWCFNVAEDLQTDLCEIIGSEGSIRFAFFGNYVSWKNVREDRTETFIHPPHIQQPMIAGVVEYFNGTGDNPCPIEDAIVLMQIMDKFSNK